MNSSEQIRHFLAQVSVETGNGRLIEEKDWHGDNFAHVSGGPKYRGAGYIQLTHDYTYKSFASYVGDPKIVSEGYEYVAKNYAWDAAAWFWTEYKNIDDLIDKGATVETITKKVTGGTRGVSNRSMYYEKLGPLLENYIN